MQVTFMSTMFSEIEKITFFLKSICNFIFCQMPANVELQGIGNSRNFSRESSDFFIKIQC